MQRQLMELIHLNRYNVENYWDYVYWPKAAKSDHELDLFSGPGNYSDSGVYGVCRFRGLSFALTLSRAFSKLSLYISLGLMDCFVVCQQFPHNSIFSSDGIEYHIFSYFDTIDTSDT